MLGYLLLSIFLGAGVVLSDAVLRRQGRMTRLWMGLTMGLAMMMWFPSLYAFFMRFSVKAQWCAGATALLLGGGAQVVVRLMHREQPPIRTKREPPVLLLLCLVVPFVLVMGYLQYTHIIRPENGALYTGQSTYGDLNLHLGIASGLVDAAYPPEYNILPGALLGYPFLTDALSASMYILGTPLRWAFVVPGVLMSTLVFWGFVMLAWRMTKKKSATILAFLLLFLNGGLGFIYVLDQVGADPSALLSCMNDYYQAPANLVDKNIRWVNVLVDMMLPQRTLLAGWMMVIPALWLLIEAVNSKHSRRDFVLLGIWGGAMPMIHTHSFLALGLITIGVMIWALKEAEGTRRKQLFWGFAIYGALAAVLAAPQLLKWSLPQTIDGGSLRFRFNWVNWKGDGLIDEYFWFWLKNIGPVYLVLLPAAFAAPRRLRGFALGAGLIWLVAETILFQPNDYDNNKLFYVAFIMLLPMAASYLVTLYDRIRDLPGRRILACAFLIVSLLSGTLSVAREWKSEYQLYSVPHTEAAQAILTNTPQDAVFLTCDNHNNTVAVLTGRRIVCGTGSFLHYHGIDYAQQRADEQTMYEQPAQSQALFEKYGVDYLFISSYERMNFRIDLDAIAEMYPLVYNNIDIQIRAVSDRAREKGTWQ